VKRGTGLVNNELYVGRLIYAKKVEPLAEALNLAEGGRGPRKRCGC
jgi:hypothetical protein